MSKIVKLDVKVVDQMVINQYNLNDGIGGPEWILGFTKDKKFINWPRCCYMEGAETVDSYPYKHWKSIDAYVNSLNVKIELSDIWHFLISLICEHKFSEYCQDNNINVMALEYTELKNIFMENVKDGVVEMLLTYEYEDTALIEDLGIAEQKSALKMGAPELPYVDKFISLSALLSIDKLVRNEFTCSNYSIELLPYLFHKICSLVNLNIETLYYAKTELNKFRQLNGYKEGIYKKIWDYNGKKVEDNVVLFELVENNITKENLITELQKIYDKMPKDFKLKPADREVFESAYCDYMLESLKDDFIKEDFTVLAAYISGEGMTQSKDLSDRELLNEIIDAHDNFNKFQDLEELINKYK